MTRIREDPSLKPILEEIESGGPAAMMRLVIIISSILLLLAYKMGKNLKIVAMFSCLDISKDGSFKLVLFSQLTDSQIMLA